VIWRGVAVYYSLSTHTLHSSTHSLLFSYIGDYLLQLHPLGAPLVIKISSITSMNASAWIYLSNCGIGFLTPAHRTPHTAPPALKSTTPSPLPKTFGPPAKKRTPAIRTKGQLLHGSCVWGAEHGPERYATSWFVANSVQCSLQGACSMSG
jgi:hypothetical protein